MSENPAESNSVESNPASPAKRSLRLLYLIDEMKALTDGGTERQVLQMIRLMTARGAHVELCTLRGTDWLTAEMAGCPVRSWGVGSVLAPRGLWKLLKLASWMRRQRFDILQTFFVDANLIGPWLGRWAGVKAVLGSRRNLNYWMSSRQRVLQSWSNKLSTRLVANCEAVRVSTATIEKVPLAKIDVMYNGLDTERFARNAERRAAVRKQYGYADDEVLIGMVAVLRPVKGCDVFVEAAAQVAKDAPNTRFVLVGDGPLREELGRKAEAKGLGNRLRFTGSVEDIPGILCAFDIAVLSSLSEGFSNSILEYLAMSLPTVVSDVGGNAEAVGTAGFVVPAGDANALAACLLELAKDTLRRVKAGAEGRSRSLDFSLGRTGDEIARYYSRLIDLP